LLKNKEKLQISIEELQKIAQVNVLGLLCLILEEIDLLLEHAALSGLRRLGNQEPDYFDHQMKQVDHAVGLVVLHPAHERLK